MFGTQHHTTTHVISRKSCGDILVFGYFPFWKIFDFVFLSNDDDWQFSYEYFDCSIIVT